MILLNVCTSIKCFIAYVFFYVASKTINRSKRIQSKAVAALGLSYFNVFCWTEELQDMFANLHCVFVSALSHPIPFDVEIIQQKFVFYI